MYVCMYVCVYVCMCMYVCVYVCVYVCMYACMYVCMYVCERLQFRNVHNYWNIMTNRMHDSSSSRSTVYVGRSLFVRLYFPTIVSSVGGLTVVTSFCL